MRPLLLNASSYRLLGAAAQLTGINDNRPIRIFDVLQRALGEPTAVQLSDGISIWNSAELVETPRRTPTPAIDSVCKRDIERCAINACLATRDYFHLPCDAFNRRLEQCPRARSSKLRFVQAHGCDGAHLSARRSLDAAQDRRRDLRDRSGTFRRARKRIRQCPCVHASDTRPAR